MRGFTLVCVVGVAGFIGVAILIGVLRGGIGGDGVLSLAVENVEPTHTPYPEISWDAGLGNGVVWVHLKKFGGKFALTPAGRELFYPLGFNASTPGWDKNPDLEDLVVPECSDPSGYVDIVFAWRERTNPPEVIQIGAVDFRDSFTVYGSGDQDAIAGWEHDDFALLNGTQDMYVMGINEMLSCEVVSGKRIILGNNVVSPLEVRLPTSAPTHTPRALPGRVTWVSGGGVGFRVGSEVDLKLGGRKATERTFSSERAGDGFDPQDFDNVSKGNVSEKVVVPGCALPLELYVSYGIAWPVGGNPPTMVEVSGSNILEAFVVQGGDGTSDPSGWGAKEYDTLFIDGLEYNVMYSRTGVDCGALDGVTWTLHN